MRFGTVLLVILVLLVAGFAALNWGEVVRTTPLLFGPVVMEAPLGAILLGLLALTLIAYLIGAAAMRTQMLRESRHHQKELERQRELADKAEASRYTDLRQLMENELRQLRERDAIAAGELERTRLEHQKELRNQLEQINRTIAARLTELEHRLDQRLEGRRAEHEHTVTTAATPVLPAPPRDEHVHPAEAHSEHASAEEREQQLHEQRMREERRRAEEHAEAADRAQRERREEAKPTATEQPSGWRRWF